MVKVVLVANPGVICDSLFYFLTANSNTFVVNQAREEIDNNFCLQRNFNCSHCNFGTVQGEGANITKFVIYLQFGEKSSQFYQKQ